LLLLNKKTNNNIKTINIKNKKMLPLYSSDLNIFPINKVKKPIKTINANIIVNLDKNLFSL
jgi:hypothetical protein